MLITVLSKNKIVENVSAGGGDNNTSSVGLGFVKTCGEFALRSGKKFILKIYESFTKYNDIMTFSSTWETVVDQARQKMSDVLHLFITQLQM